MEKTFILFCQQIDFEISSNFENSIIKNVVLIEKDNQKPITNFEVSFFYIPTKKELISFSQKSKKFFLPSETLFDFSFINKNYSNQSIFEILGFYIDFILNKDSDQFIKIENVSFDSTKNKFTIFFDSIIDYSEFNNFFNSNKFISFFKLNDLSIETIDRSAQNFKLELEQKEKEYQLEFQELLKNKKINQTESKPKKNLNRTFSNKDSKYFKVNLNEFYSTHEKFLLVEGKVFSIDITQTKTKLNIMSILITDGDEAINLKHFYREEENQFNWIEKGMNISVFGEKKQEYNLNSYFLFIVKADQIKIDQIFDKSENKRIEFSARTSMSAMDGFISPTDMMKFAKNIGHEAIAFVDFQNIQSFPEIYSSSKKIGIKPIYGSTFSVILKKNNLVLNPKNTFLKKEKYVIFDLETTSLNPRFGEIIEFGAIIVENNLVIDKIQFFVKPSEPISKFTTELTGITQKMLDEQYKFDNQKDAIEEILKIFKDYTLVAHNASFDIGYINEKMFQFNLGQLKNQIVDTLTIARYLFPFSISYRLEVISKKLNVVYDSSIAHRADYDAEVLQKVWFNMIDLLINNNLTNFVDIANIQSKILYEKQFSYDLSIYVKNQVGLKELFKLVSSSLTSNYYDGPKLFEEDLKKSPNLLIGPSSINSRLINLMQTGTTKDLEEEIEKWDFIGIPSPHLFSHLISRGNFDEKQVHKMLKDLIYRAKKKNKIIIAIGDVRYLTKEDSLAHKIYINTKGLEGKRHYLYKYNEIEPKYPIQKFLTTEQMLKQFEFLNSSDLAYEIVVKNTIFLNSLIENDIQVIKTKLYPPKLDSSEKNLIELVYQKAKSIYGNNLPSIVKKRIEKELEPIIKYGFSVVYWISQKLVKKSIEDGYLVGSRGSVGSSIVATLAGITEVNPLSPHYFCLKCNYVEFVENPKTSSGFDLPSKNCINCNIKLSSDGQTIPFETFLGFDGDKVPDIDLNFSGDYQPIIHQEVRKIFGENHSFRAGTISTVASKTAFGYVKKYFEDNQINKSNHFINYLANQIEGSKRTTGQHPGGIIIIPKDFDVEDFTPINYPANDTNSSWKTTHFDFHAIHDNVLKLDLLGHDDPTVIRQLQKLTNVKISDISFSDENVLKLFSSTEPLGIKAEDINNESTGVLGIPEFGTKFVRKMLKVAKPNSFNDLINISGLSHGTNVWAGNAEELVKMGKSLSEVVSCRDDIMVYLIQKGINPSLSFQIMEKVRKGQGVKPEDEKVLKEFGIENWYIDSLNKIKYMFPKAHATAYVMMAWRIAWFKIYYPLEYYATYLTVKTDVFDLENALGDKFKIERKLKELEQKQYSKNSKEKISAKEEELINIFEVINEMIARNIKISNIDLDISDATEWKIDYENNSLIPPFVVLDGLGISAANSIIQARKEKKFSSKDDLSKRTQINKTVLEKMEKLEITKSLGQTDQIKLF